MSDSIGSGPAEDSERMRSGRLYLGKAERAHITRFKRVWRILTAVVASGVLGGVLGWLLLPWFDAFDNAWIGGALATPVGFLAGLWWQFSNRKRRRVTPLLVVVGLGLLALVGAPIGAVIEIGCQKDLARRLDALTSLPQDSLKRIAFWDRYGRERLLTIQDQAILGDFVRACRDAKGYSPNHPRYEPSWYVVLDGKDTLELICHYEDRWPNNVVGYFVRKQGDSTHFHGSFISENLRPWFEKHVENMKADADGQEASPPVR